MQINNQLNMYDLTTFDCTYYYTHSLKMDKYEICTTTCVIPISAKSYTICAMLPLVSQVTSMPALLPGAVQSVLLNPYQINNKHGTMSRLPPVAH